MCPSDTLKMGWREAIVKENLMVGMRSRQLAEPGVYYSDLI